MWESVSGKWKEAVGPAYFCVCRSMNMDCMDIRKGKTQVQLRC